MRVKAWGALLLLWSSAASADPTGDLYASFQQWRGLRASDSAPRISETTFRAAVGGKTQSGVEFVEGVDAGKGWALGILESPIWAVWQAVLDAPNLSRFMPIDHSAAIQRARLSGAVVFQYMSLPVVSDRWWCVQQQHNRRLYEASNGLAWELTWKDRHGEAICQDNLPAIAAEGMAVDWSRGAWLLIDLGDQRTLVEYHTWADPGGYLPAEQASRVAAGKVAETLQGIHAGAQWQLSRSSQGFVRPDGSPLRP